MKEILENGRDVIFYELDELETLPEQIRSVLSDRDKWEEMQQHAFDTASSAHTWEHRARSIHEEILCKIS